MLLDKISTILKSLRFRLTLLYSMILLVFISSFVAGVNIYLYSYFRQEPPPMPIRRLEIITKENPFREFNEDQLRRVRDMRLQDFRQIRFVSTISLIPITFLSFFIGYYTSGQVLYPLKNLNKNIRNLNDSELGMQIEVDSDDEIGKLAKSFNEMSLRLKTSFDNQSQFVQDASHELRTPLTVIRTNLDAVLDDRNATKEDMKKAIINSVNNVDRLKKMSDYLLELTPSKKATKVKINLIQIISSELKALESFRKESGVDIQFIFPKKNIELHVNKLSIESAIKNIIENAIKYSKGVKSPKVIIKIEKLPNKVLITVEDNGGGIPKELQGKIFDRFFRTDKSRNSKTGGFGLGLAIAKKNITENGGKISLKSRPGSTQFFIELPAYSHS